MKKGDEFEVEVLRLTEQGKGLAYHSDGTLVIIDGISGDDDVVNVRIDSVLGESVLASKTRKKNVKKSSTDEELKNSPYDMDDDDEEY